MTDILSKPARARLMASVKTRDTKPELIVRKAVHARGLRYRVNLNALPGKPDMVFPKFRSVVFVHGCFWHKHDCHLFKWPSTREEFWRKKLLGNEKRDELNKKRLNEKGWRVMEVWECSVRGKTRKAADQVAERINAWLRSDEGNSWISGQI